jgi:hypothetical protein
VLEFVIMHIVGSVCMPLSISTFSCFISHSAVLPRSSPSSSPSS